MPADGVNDTSAAARDVIVRRLRAMSLAEKCEAIRGITHTVNQLALAGLRGRNPDASEGELLLMLARLRLGDELVDRVYGESRK